MERSMEATRETATPATRPAPGAALHPVTLAGDHVRLEPLSLAHLPALCDVGLDPELWRISVSRMATPDDMRRYVEQALELQAAGTALPFATTL